MVVQISRSPSDIGLPWQNRDRVGVGVDRGLVVIWTLTQAVDGGTSERLRAAHHALEVAERDALRFGNAVYVDVGGQTIFDAIPLQLILQDLQVDLVEFAGRASLSARQ